MVWSHKLTFKVWKRSKQWLLRYYTFNIWGRLLLEVISIWNKFNLMFGLGNKLKFKIWGRSDQCLLKYFNFNIWVHHNFKVWFDHISLSLKFGEDLTIIIILQFKFGNTYSVYLNYEIGQSSSRHSSLKSNLIGLIWIASWAAV